MVLLLVLELPRYCGRNIAGAEGKSRLCRVWRPWPTLHRRRVARTSAIRTAERLLLSYCRFDAMGQFSEIF